MAEKEYIEREALLAAYDAEHVGPPGRARELIANSSTADVRPVVHGKWEHVNITYLDDMDEEAREALAIASMFCPNCKRYHNEVYIYGNPTENVNFCPKCGADMRQEKRRRAEICTM